MARPTARRMRPSVCILAQLRSPVRALAKLELLRHQSVSDALCRSDGPSAVVRYGALASGGLALLLFQKKCRCIFGPPGSSTLRFRRLYYTHAISHAMISRSKHPKKLRLAAFERKITPIQSFQGSLE